ncbi:hypothetical protein OA501_00605 [Flavobacteriaceae bacterium]|nr:hypothetical protein [Flavobacteriaceae bacterium]
MKITLRIFLLIALGMMLFNIYQINWEAPLVEKSAIAVIGTIASASAFLLISILILSRKVAEKLKNKSS